MPLPRLTRTLHPIPARPERVLQFGGGNFLRGFLDWMIHEMNLRAGFDAGVVVVQSVNQRAAGTFNAQDGLYTLCLTDVRDGRPEEELILVDCIRRSLSAGRDYAAFLACARDPGFRFVVSNTTEAGIAFDERDRFDDAPPGSFPAKLTRWLYERFRHFGGDRSRGLIVLPCELIDRNGAVLREIVGRYARHWQLPSVFGDWLGEACIFCDTLVDRIVPGYPHARIAELEQRLGYTDELLTGGERFHLLVIEAPAAVAREFPAREAGLNVVFTDDIRPYRTRKVRILNGAHTAIAPVAYLAGLRTVREAVEHPQLGDFVARLVYEEILPTLDLPEGERRAYAADVLRRFRNPYIHHRLISIALNSTAKFTTRLLPSLLAYFEQWGELPARLVLALAALIRFYRGDTPEGEAIPLNDEAERLVFFRELWAESGRNLPRLVQTVLGRTDFWGRDLNATPGLAERVVRYLDILEYQGVGEAIRENIL